MLIDLDPVGVTERITKIKRKQIRSELNYLFATKHALNVSDDNESIAHAIGVSVKKVEEMREKPLWTEALYFWGWRPKKTKIRIPTGAKATLKDELYLSQHGCCYGCRRWFPLRNLTFDHIKPKSLGGSNERSNLQLLCHACNHEKDDGTQQELVESLKKQGILEA